MNVSALRFGVSYVLLSAAVTLCACASHPRESTEQQEVATYQEEFNDPFEDTNRKIFEFNQFVDRNAIAPAAKAYRTVFPDPVRDSFRDFLYNLREPLIFANDALQGQFESAGKDIARFVVNSTIGMAGTVDVMGRWGVPYHEEDLGLTLGSWGVPEGPYLIVPILGPSTPRDLGGQVAEGFGDPWNRLVSGNPWTLYWIPYARGALSGIDTRSRYIETLADIERTSLDYYATIRSLYRQRRAALIRHEKEEELPPKAGFSRREDHGSPFTSVNTAARPAMISDASNLSEVSK
jgi:phospholipid-binding lipoprotein MlaA